MHIRHRRAATARETVSRTTITVLLRLYNYVMIDRTRYHGPVRVTIFADENCITCRKAVAFVNRLRDSRNDFELTVYRRGSDGEEFTRYGVVICPAVFVQGDFLGYGTPDAGMLEKALDRVKLRESLRRTGEARRKNSR